MHNLLFCDPLHFSFVVSESSIGLKISCTTLLLLMLISILLGNFISVIAAKQPYIPAQWLH